MQSSDFEEYDFDPDKPMKECHCEFCGKLEICRMHYGISNNWLCEECYEEVENDLL
jgi:hypothetical protein